MQGRFKYFGQELNRVAPVYGVPSGREGTGQLRTHYDTAVIGGGLAGLSTALELGRAGKSVLVCEADKIGAGASGRCGGQLWPGFESGFLDMQTQLGPNHATAAWGLVHDGLKLLHSRLGKAPDHCEFRPGVLLAGMSTEDNQRCQQEAAALQRAGFDFAEYVDAQSIRQRLFSTTMFTGGLLYQGHEAAQYGHINPLRYMQLLASLTRDAGADIVEQMPVKAVMPRAEGGYTLTAGEQTVTADHVVLATGASARRPEGVGYDLLPRQFIRAQTVILATEPMERELAQQLVPGNACFADMRDRSMNYGRLIEAGDLTDRVRMTFGGADALMQAQTALAAGRIERDLYRAFPALLEHNIKVTAAWGGYCDLSRDSLPRLSEVRENFYQMSGFSGQGLVLTTVLANATAEKIVQGASEKFDMLAALAIEAQPFHRSESIAKLNYAASLIRVDVKDVLTHLRRIYRSKPPAA